MKRIITVSLVVLMISLLLCSCGKSEAAKAVEAKIDAIESIDLTKGDAIEEAENAYAMLPGEEKKDVKNYDELKEIRAEYDKLKAFNEKADEFIKLIDRTFSEYGVAYSEFAELFNSLTEENNECSEKVKEEYAKIFEPVKTKNDEYNTVCEAAVKSAVSYINGFKKATGIESFVLNQINAIAQKSDGNTYYLFAMTYTDDSGAEKSIYSSARFAGTPSVDSMMSYKDNFYSEIPMSDKTNALKSGNVILDVNEVTALL